MTPDADVLICGGAIIGSATAYYLTALGHGGRIVVAFKVWYCSGEYPKFAAHFLFRAGDRREAVPPPGS